MGHAYYEFQHVELANVGSGKKRQPYAGLSDLLTSEPAAPCEPRPPSRVRNPPGGPTSNIFAAEEVTPPRSSRTNKMASSIPFGVDCVDSPPSSTTSSPPPTPVKPASPNPVTGQGYEPAEVMKKPTPQPAAATPRRRIPPGGYSSPLW
ncbi:microtubule-associated protein Jupiter-like isoform X3 [Amphibalanus amphitrite]|uniref:microtubule-associated protein Jupiter-like isoform X3 n=1 Tax=Amphibalanus amphitrite TaxID=1232801 RepID=UPI001C8FE819|nr:microtubule-associated protein Jupiter-like isoform X3 [Amphibalanus amphitrite]